MRLGELAPGYVEPGGLELFDLPPGGGAGDKRVLSAVGKEHSLLSGDGRQFTQQFVRLVDVSADADQPRQQVRITKAHVDRHQAALREAEQGRQLGWESGGPLRVK